MDPPSQNSQKRFDLEDLNFMFLGHRNVGTVSSKKKTDNAIGLDSKRDGNPIHNAPSNSRPAIANDTWHALDMITKAEEKDRHERLDILKSNQEILKTNQEILKAQEEARKQRGEVVDTSPFGSNQSNVPANNVSQPRFGGFQSNVPANQASEKSVSFGNNPFKVPADKASQPRSGILENDTSHNSAPFGSKLLVGTAPDGNANSNSSPNVPVQPQPIKNASANSPTCASGQPSPVPTLFGRVGAQKPQTGPENRAKTQITTPTAGKRQAEDQPSTANPSQDASPPKKLLKREPSDKSGVKNLPPATNANPPDIVFLSSSTITKELQSFGSKIKELQERIEARDNAILKRRELNAWREEDRQKLSARRAICLTELNKIQKEEEDLEEQFREKTSVKMEKTHESSA
ncbi:hypothetical protein V8F06_005595 [Rhypophila decipiens]